MGPSQSKQGQRQELPENRAKLRQYVKLVDVDSGEVVKSYWTSFARRVPQFFRVYRSNWRQIVQLRKLTLQETGLLFMLMAYLQWGGPFTVDANTGKNLSESDLADLLGLSRATIHRLLRALNKKGLVCLIKRGEGRPNHVMLNSNLLFFGKEMFNPHDHAVFNDTAWRPKREIKYN